MRGRGRAWWWGWWRRDLEEVEEVKEVEEIEEKIGRSLPQS